MKTLIMACAVLAAVSSEAVRFEHVLVRQQWPWSAKVHIDYVLADTDGKTWDIEVALRSGGETLSVPDKSFSGDRYSVSAGQHRIVWDPSLTSYTNRLAIADVEVTLSAQNTDAKRYLIIDMSVGAVNGQASAIWPVTYTNEIADADGDGKWDREFKLTKMVFRRIEPGTFTMGVPSTEWGSYGNNSSTSEKQHTVVITKPFYLGVFPVTAQQFYQTKAYWGNTKYGKKTATAARPANNFSYNSLRGSVSNGINWPSTGYAVYDDPSIEIFSNVNGSAANNLCVLAWFRRHVPGLVVDLPTEAQWEYCCRAGTSPHSFYNGVDLNSSAYQRTMDIPAPGIDAIARTRHNSFQYNASDGTWTDPGVDDTEYGTCDVGSYEPNAWGLYDMHGNVNEWCLDWYNNGALVDETDPKGPLTSPEATPHRVYRGGGYNSMPSDARAGFRGAAKPDEGYNYAHFGYRFAIHLD